MKQVTDIDQYILDFPAYTKKLLEQMRSTIHKAAPKASEAIRYGIPTFVLEGNLVHFAGYKHHIGFYPGAAGIAAFKKELSVYKNAKGSVQFPLDQKLPLALVTQIVQFRVQANLQKAEEKRLKKKPRNTSIDFLSTLSAPARRSLESKNITTLKKLCGYSEADILSFHGMGPASIPKLRSALKTAGLSFKK